MVGSTHPGGGEAAKGWTVRPLKRYVSWVQTVNLGGVSMQIDTITKSTISVNSYCMLNLSCARIIPREVINPAFMEISNLDKAYLAGFLDADGSIYVRLKPNNTYRFKFQISPNIVFYQSSKERQALEGFQKLTKIGYLRDRNDGIVEYTIGDRPSIRKLVKWTLPYLKLKKKQAKLMLLILDKCEKIHSAKDFISVAKLIDRFGELNYSKRRTVNAAQVNSLLKNKGLLTP